MEQRSTKKTVAQVAKVVSYILYFWLISTLAILLLGFLLLLFGANPDAGFTEWAYRNLERVMEPFRGIFEPVRLGSGGNGVEATVDTSILFAMVVYGMIVLALRAAIEWVNMRVSAMEREEFEAVARERAMPPMPPYASDATQEPIANDPAGLNTLR